MLLARRRVVAATALSLLAASPAASAMVPSAHPAARPTIGRLSIDSGPTRGGTTVTVRGQHFVKVSEVRFGSLRGRAVHVVSPLSLTVIAPKQTGRTVDVRVVTNAGTSPRTTADRFQYVAPPAVRSVSPAHGSADGGSRVTVHGAGFRGVSAVRFGTQPATRVRVTSPGTLTATAPAHGPGTAHVRVVAKYGTSPAVAADRFVFDVDPAPVAALTVADTTATSALLTWLPSPSADVTGVTIRRLAGATPPDSASGDLAATLPTDVVEYRDAGLDAGTEYSYAVFADRKHAPTHSTPDTATATTASATRPASPTDLIVVPASPAAAPGPCSGVSGVRPAVGSTFRLAATVANPDAASTGVRAEFELRDLGTDRNQAPVDLVTATDTAGWTTKSSSGSAQIVTQDFDGTLLTDGHTYSVDAIASDGATDSLPSASCTFWYDAGKPTVLKVKQNHQATVGKPATFTVNFAETPPADGPFSGLDHLDWSLSQFGPATSVRGKGTALARTATITFTPTVWGSNYLYLVAYDAAGNRSFTDTYTFYVTD
jgi:hypothetical protein